MVGQRTSTPASSKRPARDTSRRVTHSQIERRRREKINDRLITLRTIVPACLEEIESRKRQREDDDEQVRKIAAGEEVRCGNDKNSKRRRKRRRAAAAATATTAMEDKGEEELGMHKLEVLTHTIDYIFALQSRIAELETGKACVRTDWKKGRSGDDEDDLVVHEEPVSQIIASPTHVDDGDESSDADSDRDEKRRKHRITSPTEVITAKHTQPLWPLSRQHSRYSSASSSSLSTSPGIMRISADSPVFSSVPSTSSTAFTHLTSPMMSLSSESPIMRGVAKSGLSNSHRMNTTLTTDRSWQLPEAALPLDRHEEVHASSSRRTSQGGPSSTTTQEANLLLHIGTSPEVMRPVSDIRHTAFASMQRRQTTSSALASMSKMLGQGEDRRVINSASGGTRPQSSTSRLLTSPPPLALDAVMAEEM